MYRFPLFLACLFLLSLLSLSYAENNRWQELLQQADSLCHQKKYSQALEKAREAVSEASKECCPPDYPSIHASLTQYAEILEAWGKYPEAEAGFLNAFRSSGGEIPDRNLEMQSLRNLRQLYAIWKKIPESIAISAVYEEGIDTVKAEAVLQEKVEASLQRRGMKEAVDNLAALAVLYRDFHSPGSAQKLEDYLGKIKKNGLDDLKLADCLEKVGEVLDDLGSRRTHAASLFKEALALRQRHLQPDDPEIARSLHNLAKTFDYRSPEKEALLKQALKIKTKNFGPENLLLADTLEQLAHVYWTRGWNSLAGCCFERCGNIRENSCLPDASLDLAADVYEAAEEYAKAERIAKRQLSEAVELSPQEAFPDLGSRLARLYEAQRKYPEAEALYKRWLQCQEPASGANYTDSPDPIVGLANLYVRQKKFAQADRLLSEAWKDRSQLPAPQNEDFFAIFTEAKMGQGELHQADELLQKCQAGCSRQIDGRPLCCATELASLYESQGKIDEAAAVLRLLLTAWENDHPEYRFPDALERLAQLYLRHNRLHDAEKAYTRAGTILEAKCRAGCIVQEVWLDSFAELYEDAGVYDKAETLYLRNLRIQESSIGNEHGRTMESVRKIAALYRKMGKPRKSAEYLKRVREWKLRMRNLEKGLGCRPDELSRGYTPPVRSTEFASGISRRGLPASGHFGAFRCDDL